MSSKNPYAVEQCIAIVVSVVLTIGIVMAGLGLGVLILSVGL